MFQGDSQNEKGVARNALRQALALYQRLSRALGDIIARLESATGQDALVDADDLATLKLHHNALMTVLSFELQIFKRDAANAVGAGEKLDLEAARNEIARRLHRLAG